MSEIDTKELPPVGSVWRKVAWGDRTILSHRYNSWGKCWWVRLRHEHGEMEIPLSKWRKWADGAKRIDITGQNDDRGVFARIHEKDCPDAP